MTTDLKQLHEYQNRIDVDIIKEEKPSGKGGNESNQNDSIWSFFNKESERNKAQVFIDSEEEKFHKVLSKVGEGATSIVYKVVDTRDNRVMCKKIIKFDPNNPYVFEKAKAAMKEFDLLFSIHHPCICEALYVNTQETFKDRNVDAETDEETTIALFLEFIDFDLKKLIQNGVNNTLKTRIVVDIAHAMNFLHKNGMIHRDLKAENVSLNSVYEAKLIYFGLVKIYECLNQEYSFVKESMSRGVGTLAYMSPEMASEESYDYKTDVYSFGILLHFIFFGRVPDQKIKD